MASDSTNRAHFIKSAIKVARDYGFSGLDLYWKYPATKADMDNLGTLLSEWRQAIITEPTSRGQSALLLTAAVFFLPTVNSLSYPADKINSYTDWVNVMAYDFHNPSKEKFTNSHSMLYDPDPSTKVSGDAGIRAWIDAGVSANKLVLGLPFYGYGWILADASKHDRLAPAIGPAFPDDGLQTYKEITAFKKEKEKEKGAHVEYDKDTCTNYCYWKSTWIGYNDTQSISAKVSYAKQQKLLGYFVWSVGGDDDKWTLSNLAKQVWEAPEVGLSSNV